MLLEKGKDIISLSDRARELERTLVDSESTTEEIDVSALLEAQITSLKEDYPEATFSINADTGIVVTATPLLDSTFENLLTNAIEHNDSAEPEIKVEVEVPDDNAEVVKIRISDNGPGIPVREQHVLERGRETPLDHSSGLGLWIVHWLITESGGSIEFEDNEPRGAVVTVTLPLSEKYSGQ